LTDLTNFFNRSIPTYSALTSFVTLSILILGRASEAHELQNAIANLQIFEPFVIVSSRLRQASSMEAR